MAEIGSRLHFLGLDVKLCQHGNGKEFLVDLPPSSKSHHQEYYMFSREPPKKTFLYNCCWVGRLFIGFPGSKNFLPWNEIGFVFWGMEHHNCTEVKHLIIVANRLSPKYLELWNTLLLEPP